MHCQISFKVALITGLLVILTSMTLVPPASSADIMAPDNIIQKVRDYLAARSINGQADLVASGLATRAPVTPRELNQLTILNQPPASDQSDRVIPIITSNDFFQDVGDYYRSWANTSNVSVSGLLGLPGIEQTWDFSEGPDDEIKRFDYVVTSDGDDAGAGFYAADHYPDAVFSQRLTEEYAGGNAWMYLDQIDGIGRRNYGYYFPDGNALTNDWSVFTPPLLDFPDPLTFGTAWLISSSYQFQMYDTGMVLDIRVDLTIDAEVDAWGTVILPTLGPIEALRVNTEQTGLLYVWLGDQWMSVGTQFVRIYDWIGKDSDLIVEITSTVSETSMPADEFTIAGGFVRQFENSNPTALPVISEIPDATIWETDSAFSYDVEATGMPTPTFSLSVAPDGMSIGETDGVINWTPTSADVGTHQIIVEADNGIGTDTETFEIDVINLNEPPQNLFATLFDTGTANLSWQAPVNGYWLSGYAVYRATEAGGPYTLVDQTASDQLSIELTSPGGGISSFYVVTAVLSYDLLTYDSFYSNEILTYSFGDGEAGCFNDDGIAESGHLAGGANGEMAVLLDLPTSNEVSMTKFAVYLTELAGAPITLKVSADDAGGYPGSSLAQAQYPAHMLRLGWNILEIPEFMQPSFTGGRFFAGLVEGTENNTVGLDEGSYGHSFTKAPGGAWSFMFSGELMFRAIINGGLSGVDDHPVNAIPNLQMTHAPDPARAETRIDYGLPGASPVTIRIYSLTGRVIRNLFNSPAEVSGPHSITWDGLDDSGHRVASGTYFYRLETDKGTLTKKMIRTR